MTNVPFGDDEDFYEEEDTSGHDEYSHDPGHFDGGYGPDSYFAHAMSKDD